VCLFSIFFIIFHSLGRPLPKTDLEEPEQTPTIVKGFVSKNGNQEDGQIISVAAGDSHTLFLSQSGNVYMVGMFKDADSGMFHDVRSPEENPFGGNSTPVHVSRLPQNVMQIFARGGFSVAMLSDRSVVTWGKYNKPQEILFCTHALLLLTLEIGVFFNIYFRVWQQRRTCTQRRHGQSQRKGRV
jgi:hypothetical protein